MSWTLCTSAAAIFAAGINIKSDLMTSSAILATLSNEAEGELCVETGRDWVTNVASLNPQTSGAIFSNVACRVANKLIRYDMTGYLARGANTALNYNDDVIRTTTKQLKELNTLQPPKT